MKKLLEGPPGTAGRAPGATPEAAGTLEPVALLARTCFFRGLSEGQLQSVARFSELQRFEEARSVYKVGERAQALYVLVEGSVRLTIGMDHRHTSAGDILRQGDLFGWAALTPNSSRRIATALCLTPCTFLVIDGARLRALMDDNHTLGYRLTTQLVTLITGTLTAFAAG